MNLFSKLRGNNGGQHTAQAAYLGRDSSWSKCMGHVLSNDKRYGMDSIFGSLIRDEEHETKYPVFTQSRGFDGAINRVQIEVGPKRFAMVIRHPEGKHLCCYVMCLWDTWEEIHHYILHAWRSKYRRIPIDYEGSGSDVITWMTPDSLGKLTRPGLTGVSQDGHDFWVGFALEESQTDLTVGMRLALELESMIHDFTSSRQAGDL